MANDFNRMSNAFFSNFSNFAQPQNYPQQQQQQQQQRSGSYYGQGNFQQSQQNTQSSSNYYSAFDSPQTTANTQSSLNNSAFGYNNGSSIQHNSTRGDSSQWRQSSTTEHSSGLSSLAFASALAAGEPRPSPAYTLPQIQRSQPQVGKGASQATQPRVNAQANASFSRRTQASPVNNRPPSRSRVDQVRTSNRSTVAQSGTQQQSSNSPSTTAPTRDVNRQQNASPASVDTTATSQSQYMYVNPNEVYTPPPTYRPTPVQLPQVEAETEPGPEPEPTQAPALAPTTSNTSKTPANSTQAGKKRHRRATDESGPPARKTKARKTGSTTAPSSAKKTAAEDATPAAATATAEPQSLEAEMRLMFEKMRKFNDVNPELLAKLWQEERDNHVSKVNASLEANNTTGPAATNATAVNGAAQSTPKPKKQAKKTTAENAQPVDETPVDSTPKKKKTAKRTGKKGDPPLNAGPVEAAVEGSTEIQAEATPQSSTAAMQPIKSPSSKSHKKKATPTAAASSTPAPAPTPLTKETRALKKTFEDLVDLTNNSSDDEEGGPMFAALPQPEPPVESIEQSISRLQEVSQNQDLPASSDIDLAADSASAAPSAPAQRPVIWRSSQAPNPPKMRQRPPFNALLVEPLDKYKAMRRSTYNPRTIARDVLLAVGRHPDMRHLNEHLLLLRESFGGQMDFNSDLSTIRWNLIDPGGPEPGSASIAAEVSRVEDPGEEYVQQLPLEPVNSTPRLRGEANAHLVDNASPSFELSLRSTQDDGNSPSMSINAQGDLLPPRGRPRIRPRAPPPSGGYAALRAEQANNSSDGTVKKRGRPVGWRKWMQKGSTGSPAAPKSSLSSTALPEPVYQVYNCHWSGCEAELHNLDTLRRHVFKKHGQDTSGPPVECLWRDCGKAVSVADSGTGRLSTKWARMLFHSKPSWEEHVEKTHLSPIAWKYGDGPAGGILDLAKSEESNTFDEGGRSITPQILFTAQQGEEARRHESAMLAGSRPRKKTQEDKARDLQLAVEVEKRTVGPGIDRSGARFANEKRRMGLVDDDMSEFATDSDDE